MSHYVTKCSCGAVIAQCRCPDPHKALLILEDGCEACARQAKERAMEGLLEAKDIQSLCGTAYSLKNVFRERPWTNAELHTYLWDHYKVRSMKLVRKDWYGELLKVFAGPPITGPSAVPEGTGENIKSAAS